MCFDADSAPPIADNGKEVACKDLNLTSADGTSFAAFEAVAAGTGPAVVVLPDVRGLYRFYEELAVRFAQAGYDSVAIDYFGRTAGVDKRENDWDYMPHVQQTIAAGVTGDTAAAVAHLRSADPNRPIFTVGFCFGGSNSWLQAGSGHGLAGAIGFYGNPLAQYPQGTPTPIEAASDIACPVLGLMGGDDPSIPPDVIAEFDAALEEAGVSHEIVTYPHAPHSFFDRKQDDYGNESVDAWERVLKFIAANS
ncbi:MAG: dienelactone hydrolase family protein [Acidimicrobiia bacterium]|nr:dienelactone hydrolase family protein [Acidimicrobiia bacterium]MDH3470127.1 dienelactone hydrolase family protein [Acidimicrobiia bacterium]